MRSTERLNGARGITTESFRGAFTQPGGRAGRDQQVLANLDRLIGEFHLPQPAVMKIDVDGSEGAVLAGARETIENPILNTVFIELTGKRLRE